MLIEFQEIKNVFDDPYVIVEIAKQQTFFERNKHPYKDKVFYEGIRSDNLINIDENLHNHLNNQILNKIFFKRFEGDINRMTIEYGFKCHSYFHILREQEKFNNSWLHQDIVAALAGVVYLNPNPRPNTGTIVYNNEKSNKPTIIKNEFNKLIVYNTNYLHGAEGGFGKDIEDSRLSLVFFISELDIKIRMV